jgi:hypothetical protein
VEDGHSLPGRCDRFSKNVESHIREVDEVLKILETAGLSLNLKKCELFRSRVDYL